MQASSPVLGFPNTSGLFSLLRDLRGRPIYVLDLTDKRGRPLGNHGDWIMHRVFDRLLDDLGVDRVAASHAEAIVIPPNGALLDVYQAPGIIAERLRLLPDLPVYIFPSSARFVTSDPAEMFTGRRSPVLWISRERHSHEHLSRHWAASLSKAGVHLALDHDVVCSGHTYIPDLFPEAQPRTALVVARLEAESKPLGSRPTSPSPSRKALVAAFTNMPSARARQVVRRRVTSERQKIANAAMLATLGSKAIAFEGHPPGINLDISDPSLCTRENYRRELAGAAVVASNRLHVALPAAILGRRVFLVNTGYHKLSGVYEQSLGDVPNLTFVPN